MTRIEDIKQQFPEGLTAVFVFGGTRTSYITQRRRNEAEPGEIPDFIEYANYGLNRSLEIIVDFFELGGSNAILEILDIHRISGERGAYTNPAIDANYMLIDEQRQTFYVEHHIDPYFTGIDTLLQLPEQHLAHHLAQQLKAFQASWPSHKEHRKLIYGIASLPLYTFSQMQAEEISANNNLLNLAEQLYKRYSVAAYGFYLAPPAFYIGQARNGAMQSASRLPLALDTTGKLRLYYTPYPSLYLSRDVLEVILDDLLYGSVNSLRSKDYDYKGQISKTMADDMHKVFLELARNPKNILGLKHQQVLPE